MSILVVRPSPAGEQLVNQLNTMGRVAYHTPLIAFSPGRELVKLPYLLAQLTTGDLIFALSQNALDYAQTQLQKAAIPWPNTLQYFAIGRSTALRWQAISGQSIAFPPPPETSESLLQQLSLPDIAEKRALLLRGNGGRELLADWLSQHHVKVTWCECYQRRTINYNGVQQSTRWQQQSVTTLVVTSGEMLKQLYDLVPEEDRLGWLVHCRLIVVSQRLATLASTLGWHNIQVAKGADNNALLHATITDDGKCQNDGSKKTTREN